ncbi:hypothetical protein JXO52_01235 [bacterium]|nr:hypothetical protein [bacterium]
MQRSPFLILTLAGFLSVLQWTCAPLQPETDTGSLTIAFEQSNPDSTVSKPGESLSRLMCILKRGESTISTNYYRRTGEYFQIIIRNLLPAVNYRIILWGFDEDDALMGQCKSEEIVVEKDRVTHVTLKWNPFMLELTSPRNTVITNNNQPVFDWNSVDNALLYEFQLDTVQSYGSIRGITIQTVDSYYHSPAPLADSRYYWHVRCQDSDSVWSPYTGSYSLEIKTTGPPPPVLISPENGSTVDPGESMIFDWSDVAGAHSYHLEVSSSDSFITKQYSMGGFLNSEANVWGALNNFENGTYYWHVASRDSVGNRGDWSEPFVVHLLRYSAGLSRQGTGAAH